MLFLITCINFYPHLYGFIYTSMVKTLFDFYLFYIINNLQMCLYITNVYYFL